MTLSSILSPSVTGTGASGPGPIPAMDVDRTQWGWNGKGGGGWKGGKGNPNAALSALTLLAFLFFLNVLQSCLKDSLNQNPGVVVMMMPTPTTAAARVKREARQAKIYGESYNSEWNDDKITELVHNHVESHWSKQGTGSNKTERNYSYKKLHRYPDEGVLEEKLPNKRISTKLQSFITTKADKKEKNYFDQSLNVYQETQNSLDKETLPTTSKWMKILKTAVNISKPLIRRILCCDTVICEKSKIKGDDDLHDGSYSAITNILLWLCSGQMSDSCVDYTVKECKNPLVRNLL